MIFMCMYMYTFCLFGLPIWVQLVHVFLVLLRIPINCLAHRQLIVPVSPRFLFILVFVIIYLFFFFFFFPRLVRVSPRGPNFYSEVVLIGFRFGVHFCVVCALNVFFFIFLVKFMKLSGRLLGKKLLTQLTICFQYKYLSVNLVIFPPRFLHHYLIITYFYLFIIVHCNDLV